MAGDSLAQQLQEAYDLTPKTPEAPIVEEQETVIDEPVGVEDEQSEIAVDPVGEGQEEESGIQYFSDLAQLFEDTTEADLYNTVKFRDGQGHEYTAGEMKDRMSELLALETQKQQFETTRKQELEQLEATKAQLAQSQQAMNQLPDEVQRARDVMQAIKLQAEGVDWENLERDDPGSAALQRQKFNDAYQAANGQYQVAMQTYQAQAQAQQSQTIQQQREQLIAARPEWAEPKAFAAELDSMASALADHQITKDDLMAVNDPRIYLAFAELAKLKQDFASLKTNEKQVKERGQSPLIPRAVPQGGGKARLAKIVERGQSPNATKAEQFAAQKALVSQLL